MVGHFWSRNKVQDAHSQTDSEQSLKRPVKWSLGILNDRETDEVPGESLEMALLITTTNKHFPRRFDSLALQSVQPQRTSWSPKHAC
jgi:hypothetical protein